MKIVTCYSTTDFPNFIFDNSTLKGLGFDLRILSMCSSSKQLDEMIIQMMLINALE